MPGCCVDIGEAVVGAMSRDGRRWHGFQLPSKCLNIKFIDLICNCIRSISSLLHITSSKHFRATNEGRGLWCVCVSSTCKKLRLVCIHTRTHASKVILTHTHSLNRPPALDSYTQTISSLADISIFFIYPFFTILFDISDIRRWMLFKVHQTRHLK